MKYLTTLVLGFILFSCGSSTQKASDSDALTDQEELSIADSLSREIRDSGQDLKKETEAAKDSIDQLLEGI